MADTYERLLEALAATDGWASAATLAAQLGVSTRSVRSYVTAAKAAAHPLPIIASSGAGYRLNRDAWAAFRTDPGADRGAPRDRVRRLLRALVDSAASLDVHELSQTLHVSDSTLEADLRRVRAVAERWGLRLVRSGAEVRLEGGERERRRLLGDLIRGEGARGLPDLARIAREFGLAGLGPFKTDLLAMLEQHGYFVNEYEVDNTLLHVAIAVDRMARSAVLERPPAGPPEHAAFLPDALRALVHRHFGVELRPPEPAYLASLLTTRVIAPRPDAVDPSAPALHAHPDDLDLVRRILARVRQEFLLDLADESFVARFALHVANLVARTRDGSSSRNPLTRSIKTSYPMIYDVAVFIATVLQQERGIAVNDDEISYIALHLGAQVERQARTEETVTCAIVCPGYYDVHTLLRERVEALFGGELSVEVVVTRTDVDWNEFAADLVLTTMTGRPVPGDVVEVQPFLTAQDVESIRRALARVRRQRRRARIKDELLLYFDEHLFLREVAAPDEESVIRALGATMVSHGIVDDAYVEGAIERERMSSTAFTDSIAVPHALRMTATRTAIAVAVNEQPVRWGDSRVHVVALVAFSASGRAAFQVVFDQLVEVFADRAAVLELARTARDFDSFIEGLVHLLDE